MVGRMRGNYPSRVRSPSALSNLFVIRPMLDKDMLFTSRFSDIETSALYARRPDWAKEINQSVYF
jgi:hypothetical protein